MGRKISLFRSLVLPMISFSLLMVRKIPLILLKIVYFLYPYDSISIAMGRILLPDTLFFLPMRHLKQLYRQNYQQQIRQKIRQKTKQRIKQQTRQRIHGKQDIKFHLHHTHNLFLRRQCRNSSGLLYAKRTCCIAICQSLLYHFFCQILCTMDSFHHHIR